MRSVNKVIIIGNLTRDPEMRQTPNGQNVTTFGVATNRDWMTKDNERKSSAEFHECVAWARLAEICSKYLKKGHLVYIEGYLKTRSWDSPEGIKKFKTEIVVQDMIMLEKRKNTDEDYVPEDTPALSEETADATEEKAEEKKEEPETKEEEEATPEESPEATETPEEKPEEPTSSEENPIDKDLGL